MPEDEVIDIEDVADLLGLSRRSVLNAIKKEGLPARKVGVKYLFSKKAVLDWLAPVGSKAEVVSKEQYDRLKVAYDELKEEKDELEEVLGKLKEELECFRSAVPCSVCGKPMYPDEELVSYIRQAVKSWGHSSCIDRQKAEEGQKEASS